MLCIAFLATINTAIYGAAAGLAKRRRISGKYPLGQTELFRNTLSGTVEGCQQLIARNADINEKNESNGNAPIMGAIARLSQTTDNKFLKLLLAGKADLSVSNNDGDTPLHYATIYNCPQAIGLLLAARANTHLVNNEGKNPEELSRSVQCNDVLYAFRIHREVPGMLRDVAGMKELGIGRLVTEYMN